MISFNSDDFISGVWLISNPGVRDWFAVLKRKHGNNWETHAFFQFYQHNEFGPAGYSGGEGNTAPEIDEKILISIMSEAADGLVNMGFGSSYSYYPVGGNPYELKDILDNFSEFSNIKIKIEEIENKKLI